MLKPLQMVDVALLDEATPAAADADVAVLREDAAPEKLPPHAAELDDGSVRLPLLRPVTMKWRTSTSPDVREEVFAELVMHRLTGADMRSIQAASRETAAQVAIARSARMSPAKLNALYDRMDGADVAAASQVVAYFLDSGQPTGR